MDLIRRVWHPAKAALQDELRVDYLALMDDPGLRVNYWALGFRRVGIGIYFTVAVCCRWSLHLWSITTVTAAHVDPRALGLALSALDHGCLLRGGEDVARNYHLRHAVCIEALDQYARYGWVVDIRRAQVALLNARSDQAASAVGVV